MIDHSKEAIKGVEGKSLLPLIVEKEKELEDILERTKAECDERVRIARTEAEAYIKEVKEDLPRLAQERLKAGIKQIEQEVQNIVQASQKEIQTLQKKAAKRLETAKKAAIKLILPEIEKC
ncbi:MAG: V-type ATPase subunit subunit G family protein [Candidatus Brocadiales bacterium]